MLKGFNSTSALSVSAAVSKALPNMFSLFTSAFANSLAAPVEVSVIRASPAVHPPAPIKALKIPLL